MRDMNIDEMEAGQQLDALVAYRVMGWRPHFRNTAHWVDAEIAETVGHPQYRVRGIVGEWSPSRGIAAAWEMVEAMYGRGYDCEVEVYRNKAGDKYHRARFVPFDAQEVAGLGWADTAPLAICRAALKAAASAKHSAVAPCADLKPVPVGEKE